MSKIIKRGLHLLITMVIMLQFPLQTSIGVSAADSDTFDYTVGNVSITYQVTSYEDKTVEVISGPGITYSGDVTIPDKVKFDDVEYTVIGIGEFAFANHKKLGTITIPGSIEYIGNYAFSYCVFDKMIVNREVPPMLGEGVFSYSTEFALVIPNGTTETYGASGWPTNCYTISGRVTNFTTGNDIEDVEVTLYDESNKFIAQTTTDGKGYYTLQTNILAWGNYTIKTKKVGCSDESQSVFLGSNNKLTEVNFRLKNVYTIL